MVWIVLLCIYLLSLFLLAIYDIHRLIIIGGIKNDPGEENDLPVSVVVCAHDEEENLQKLLPVLFNQKHRTFEVIVVDDRSNDNTYDLLLEKKKAHSNLKIVKVEDTPDHINGKKYGLTLGIRAAKYEHILFTDADCAPASDEWISTIAKEYHPNTEIVLGYSPYMKQKGLLNAFIRFETLFNAIQYIGAALAGRPYMGVGRNLSYKQSVFVNKKGFNKHLRVTGGDDDLFVNEHANKSNTRVAVGKNAIVYSIPKQKLSAYIAQKKRHLSVGKLYKKRHKFKIGIVALSQIISWALLIPLLLYRFELTIVAAGYVIKMALLFLLMYKAGRQFGDKINLWLLPLFDFLWSVYYLVLGTRALFTKKVKWN